LQHQRAKRAGEEAGEVQQTETHPTDCRLEQLPELEEQEHVHADVEDAVVQEA
jgi:hypothetical protein